MTKGLGKKFKAECDAFKKSAKENVKEKYEGVVNDLKEDPFSIIDIEMVGEIINDPLGFITDLVTDKEFIGQMISAAIECVPVVGPILSSVFSLFWPEDPKMKTLTVEDLDKKLAEFKEEMVKIMDDKIKASEKETWKELCKAFFEGYIYQIDQMKKNIVILKREIQDHEGVIADVPEASKERIRVGFLSLFESANDISNFCKKQKFTNHVIEVYMQTILLQCVSTIQLCSFWYQIDLDKYYILGVKKEKEGDVEVKSIKQEYHDLLVECLKNITPAVYSNLVNSKTELNKYYNNNASKMFNTNPWIYPIPLVIAPLNVPKVAPDQYLRGSTPTINVPLEQKTPFIYRFDGANMLPDQMKEGLNGYRQIPEIDPLTQCKGTLIDFSNSINISLPERKNVTIRIFGIYPKSISELYVDTEQLKIVQKCVQDSMFCLPPSFKRGEDYDFRIEPKKNAGFAEGLYHEADGAKSGFTYLKPFNYVKTICLNIRQVTPKGVDILNRGCIRFIELIISDLSAKDLEDFKNIKLQVKEKSDKLDKLSEIEILTKEQDKEFTELTFELITNWSGDWNNFFLFTLHFYQDLNDNLPSSLTELMLKTNLKPLKTSTSQFPPNLKNLALSCSDGVLDIAPTTINH
ncbi:hypothetical protein CYY_008875 [Polysphondylium violaceum]|uniref:Pesticidal crystal protein N-terminal domain-containing protein n=1 Tax=Polysphondylium violaceum TaxID=133409 RepID=A0A8J4PUH8_9MYCE|nr:hypothetical protein CYY_008875 [Polysphondylium violaceum]